MPRYSAGVKSGAGSATLPLMSLYAAAAVGAKLREIGITNVSAVAVELKLVRLTATGTQGAGLVEAPHDPDGPTASCTAVTTHTVAPTLGADLGYRAAIGAAIGAGVIWTFGDAGLVLKPGVANGIGVIVENGTGQICQIYAVWDE